LWRAAISSIIQVVDLERDGVADARRIDAAAQALAAARAAPGDER